MDIKIQEQHVGLDQTFRGKRIGDMNAAEILAFEKFMRSKMEIVKFVYDQGGSGEVYKEIEGTQIFNGGNSFGGVFTPPAHKQKSKYSINIGGKHYNSWDEVMQDTDNPSIINKMTIDGNGNKIVEKNGIVYVNGEPVIDKTQCPIYIVINGNVEEINTQMGDVQVYGDVEHVKTVSGDIKAETIECSCSTMSGDIRANEIGGNASTMSGNVYKN